MNRGKMVLAAAALALVVGSGCACRDRPGLFSKFRARGTSADCPCPPYMNGYGMEGFGGAGMPVSMPGGGAPCPCTTMPGGPIMPNGGVPEYMPQPLPNGFPMPPGPFPGNGTPPGPATPRPADPSDPASAKKTSGIATSKPGPLQ